MHIDRKRGGPGGPGPLLAMTLALALAAHPGQAEAGSGQGPADRPMGYYSGDPLPPRTVYLTFDDGPTDFTAAILDILEEEGVRATFFLNSYDLDSRGKVDPSYNRLLSHTDDLSRMVKDGDAIGNHSYSHRDLSRLSPSGIAFQLDTLDRHFREAMAAAHVADPPRLLLVRPPFGSPWLGTWNSPAERAKVRDALKGRGLVMMWTLGWDSSDSLDRAPGEWYEAKGPRYHPGGKSYLDKMAREDLRLIKRADGEASGIVLMHDTHPTSKDVLRELIRQLKAKGYSFATLADYAAWRWGGTVLSAPSPR